VSCRGGQGVEKFGPRRKEVIERWRKLHKKSFYNLCSSPNITGVTKSTRIKGVGHLHN
jgi:hypothetical protein